MAKRNEPADSNLPDDILAKLKATKKELVKEEQKRREEIEAQKAFERQEREKNLSFAELLERHGDQGNKY
ncbi:YqkE family protein [Planococcus salinus]|uniref:DUF3886 domain-containing protein n=1 Tax=Planococcus salinus TaxID=1848460 RepID=A0A3M8PA46_9BACL|nr:YqkE family protein [Planococcus salinus]RNF40547.1 DUF3886 domain-containing protein [Planococcus salinus]